MRGSVVSGLLVLAVVLLTSGVPVAQAALEPPTGFEAKYVSSSKAVELRWTPVRGAVAYNVFRSESSGKNHKLIGSVPDARYLDKAVKPGATYYYFVTFLSSTFMESPFSDERSVGVDVPETAREAAKESGREPQRTPCRLPGYSSPDHPGNEVEAVEVGGSEYLYERGVFWIKRADQFVVVAAPVGAEVKTLPAAPEKPQGTKDAISYWCGTFFGEKEGKFQVLAAPLGAVVGYLPGGCTQTTVDGNEAYTCQESCFRPISTQESTTYQVVDCKK